MAHMSHSKIGARLPKVDDRPKITGKGIYVFDVVLPGMLWGKVLRSPHPHAEILKIDPSEAWKVSGVRSIITAEDTPKKKFCFIQDFANKQFLCDKVVRYVGDEVAAVAAESLASAKEAIERIHVEYRVLSHLDDPVEAMKPDAIRIHEDRSNIASEAHTEFGNVEAAFEKADFVFEDTFTTQKQHHGCLEPKGCVAHYNPYGGLTMWASTQAPYTLKQELSRILDMDQKDIKIIKPFVGGAFGRGLALDMIEPIAATLSNKTNRPVKIVKDRQEDFATSRTRYPFIIHLKTGVNREGRIVAKQAEVIVDNGAYNDKGLSVINFADTHFTAQYNVETLKYDAYLVYTNKQYGTAFRGFGNTQMQFAFESHLDDIAHRLGIDPMKIRLINANRSNTKTVSGAKISSCAMVDCIEAAAAQSNWFLKKSSKGTNDKKKRGMGMSAVLHTGAGSRYYGYNSSSAFIKVSDEGQVSLITPAADMGQGAETVMAQIAAEVIGIKLEDIIVRTDETDLIPYELGAFGSRTTFVCGNAVKAAAEKVRDEVMSFAGELLETQIENLIVMDGTIKRKDKSGKTVSFKDVIQYGIYQKGRAIAVSGEYFDPIAPEVRLSKGNGMIIPTWAFGCYVAEVEVDIETGEIRVLNIWAANDSGRIINKNMAESQVEGGIVQALGYALTEKLVIQNGKVDNDSFLDYKVFGAKDIPKIHCVFVEIEDPEGPFGAKGIGEHAFVAVAPAISNAIYNAIGVRLRDLPFTPEKILASIESGNKSHSSK